MAVGRLGNRPSGRSGRPLRTPSTAPCRSRVAIYGMGEDGAQQRECIRQNNLAYVGLMGIGVYMVQPFLTATSLDVSAKICVVAFAVAIPLLAALLMVTWQEGFRRRLTTSVVVNVAKAVAQTSAFVGVVAGFWHVYWIAGAVLLATAVVAVGVHSAGYVHLEPGDRGGCDGGGRRRGDRRPPRGMGPVRRGGRQAAGQAHGLLRQAGDEGHAGSRRLEGRHGPAAPAGRA